MDRETYPLGTGAECPSPSELTRRMQEAQERAAKSNRLESNMQGGMSCNQPQPPQLSLLQQQERKLSDLLDEVQKTRYAIEFLKRHPNASFLTETLRGLGVLYF